MKIVTNHQVRELIAYNDRPAEFDRLGWFDYITGEDRYSQRLFKYRGTWYDTQEFSRIVPAADAYGFEHGTRSELLLQWHGIQADSAWTAIVVRWPNVDGGYSDYDGVIVGSADWS